MVKTRFAPSPTGLLHVGNVRIALLNYLFAKHAKGEFILRIDDTDKERSTQEYTQKIKEDLQWLGLQWDSTFSQSSRFIDYQKALDWGIEQGLIYPCFETKEELETMRKKLIRLGQPPIYNRAALNLTASQIDQLQAEGRKPHYRFKVQEEDVQWTDLIKGPVSFNYQNLADPVIVKEDGTFLYTFCSVLDDLHSGITHIIRGEDHLTNTAVQVQMFKVFASFCGVEANILPQFAHISLLSMLDGSELSKRLGGNSISQMRENGILPMAINNYLFTLGQSEQATLYTNLHSLIQVFNIGNYSKSAVKFDNQKLQQINQALFKQLDWQEVEPHLIALGASPVTPALWYLYRDNLNSLAEIANYQFVLQGEGKLPDKVDQSILKLAYSLLPTDWNEESIANWFKFIGQQLNLKPKELFVAMREILTGFPHGPSCKDIALAMGKQVTTKRLQQLVGE